jgi:hypothetical protein
MGSYSSWRGGYSGRASRESVGGSNRGARVVLGALGVAGEEPAE